MTQRCSSEPCPEHTHTAEWTPRLQTADVRGDRPAGVCGQPRSLGTGLLCWVARPVPCVGEQGAAPWVLLPRQMGVHKGHGGQGQGGRPPAKSLSLTSFAAAVFRMARKYQLVVNVLFCGGQPGHTSLGAGGRQKSCLCTFKCTLILFFAAEQGC